MFKRFISPPPKSIIHSGKINFGTFNTPTKLLDIRGVSRPFFNMPTFRFMTNFRIKSSLSYLFQVGNYLGYINIFDDKIFGMAEVVIWESASDLKNNVKRVAYHAFMPMRRRFIPLDTNKSCAVSFATTRYIKIVWNRARKSLSVSFIMKGDKWRRAAKGKFFSSFASSKTGELMTVCPAPTTKRCMAQWFVASSAIGGVSFAKHRKQIKGISQDKAQIIFSMERVYLKWHTTAINLWGFDEIAGKQLQFSMSQTSQDSQDSDKFNQNVLVFDGEITALPGVFITHPYGIDKSWVIQDTENMIDLTFEPKNLLNRVFNIIIMRNAYTLIYGKFSGVLATKSGEHLELNNCVGVIKKSVLRL